jgi:hypothetical protein
MNCILATAAVDLALCTVGAPASAAYLQAALEYGNRASADFRAQVVDVSRENIDLLVYFSSMAAVVNFAMPAEGISTIQRVSTFFDMFLSSARIALTNVEWFIDSLNSAGTVVYRYPTDLDLFEALDPEIKSALDLLSSVSRGVRLPPTDSLELGLAAEGPLANDVLAYKLAVDQTKYCFAEDYHGRMKCYFSTLISVAGEEFAAGVKKMEPMAMFIIMYWGVLMDRAGKDPMLWMIVSAGRDLVDETSEVLQSSRIARIPGVQEGIAWTRRQVGLPSLPVCSLPVKTTDFVLEDGGVCRNRKCEGFPRAFEFESEVHWPLHVRGFRAKAVEYDNDG